MSFPVTISPIFFFFFLIGLFLWVCFNANPMILVGIEFPGHGAQFPINPVSAVRCLYAKLSRQTDLVLH